MNIDLDGAAFSLPERQPPGPGSFPHTSPDTLARWLDDQPVTDPGSVAETLLQATRAVNRLALKEGTLDELVDLLDDRAQPTLDALEERLRQLPVPLGRKSLALASAYGSLVQELGIAQLQCVADSLRPGSTHRQRVGRRLREALRLAGCRSLHAWRLYQQLPAGLWLQIHQILATADELGVAKEQPETTGKTGSSLPPGSIEQMVARLAVLGSSGIHALRQNEIDHLARWLALLPLSCLGDPPLDSETPFLRLLLTEDRPPSLIAGGAHPADPDTRYVDLAPVLASIRSEQPVASGHPSRWSPAMTGLDRRLLRLWVLAPRRRFSREPADSGPIITATGLAEIQTIVRADYRHQRRAARGEADFLSLGAAAFTPGQQAPARPQGTSGDDDAALSLEPRAEAVSGGTQWLADQDMDRLSAAWAAAARGVDSGAPGDVALPARMPQPIAARLRDLGAGGLGLQLRAPVQKVFTGDLIAIRTIRQERVLWQLGVIRWLKYDDPDDVTVGVQYLAPACSPTEIQLCRAQVPTGRVHPGLFFRNPSKSDEATLLFPPSAATEGARIAFRQSGERWAVTLGTIQAPSDTFSRADFPMSRATRL